MALEAVVYPQDPFGKLDVFSLLGLGGGSNWGYGSNLEEDEKSSNFLENQTESSNLYGGDWNSYSSSTPPPQPAGSISTKGPHDFSDQLLLFHNSPTDANYNSSTAISPPPEGPAAARPKRRRSKSKKNREEIENQRMTHIAVERNRRKQMNEYLSILRSLMPESYVQRGDQASIVGGAINFVKELEQRLHSVGAQNGEAADGGGVAAPFSEFFTFPQYRTSWGDSVSDSGIADIEVTMVDSHANLKIRSKRRPKQLLKVVSGLHILRLTLLHLNVTTNHHFVLYTLSLKVEDDCTVNSVDEIATAVYEMLGRIQEEAIRKS